MWTDLACHLRVAFIIIFIMVMIVWFSKCTEKPVESSDVVILQAVTLADAPCSTQVDRLINISAALAALDASVALKGEAAVSKVLKSSVSQLTSELQHVQGSLRNLFLSSPSLSRSDIQPLPRLS